MNDNIENNTDYSIDPEGDPVMDNSADSGVIAPPPPLQIMSTDIPSEESTARYSAHRGVCNGRMQTPENSDELPSEDIESISESDDTQNQEAAQNADLLETVPSQQLSALSASIPTAPAEIDDPKEYPVAPFSMNKDEMERVGLNSGNLALTVTDFVLPGKNGFDLAVTRRYNSAMSNENELTPKYEKVSKYSWRIEFTATVRDYVLNKNVSVDFWIYDETGQYRSSQEARAAAEYWWEEKWQYEFERGSVVEYYNYDTEDYHEGEIRIRGSLTYRTPYLGQYDTLISDTRPNDHLTNTYGLGLGWGFGFPSIEVVGELYKKNRVRYYNFLHLGDGQVYKLKNNQLEDYKLQDITFSSTAGSIGGRQYHYILSYKDGRKAYFNKESQDCIRLIAMTDRFNNTISFNLTSSGGSITDTLGRSIYLSRTAITGGYTLTWTLPDSSKVEYTVQDGLLTKVKDQAGQVTTYGYENYPSDWGSNFRKGYIFKSFMSWEFGDEGVRIPYRPLTDITYPTGATSKYIYEFFDYYQGGTLQGTQGMLLIRQCVDYENTGAYKNLRDYWYATDWETIGTEYDMRLYIKFARVTTNQKIDEYDFDYQKPVSKQVTKVSGVTVRERSIPTYYQDVLPTSETIYHYQNGKTLISESAWEYDPKGNMLKETLPVQGTSTMMYDDSCSLPIFRAYKKDENTEIQEFYMLSNDGKVVEWKKVYEKIDSKSPKIKETIFYQYDHDPVNNTGSHNLVAERRYAKFVNNEPIDSPDDQITAYSYANTNPQLDSAMYNGVYLTEKRIGGVKSVDGAPIEDFVERYIRDAYGRVLKKTDPCGRATSFDYDRLGRVTKETYADAASKEFRYLDKESEPKNHIVESEKDSKGNVLRSKRMEYTSLGKLERVVNTDSKPETPLSYYTYDTMNRLSSEKIYGTDGITSTDYTYDPFDRVRTKTTNGPNMPGSYQEIYTYDDAFDPEWQYTKETKEIVGSGSGSAAPSILSSVLRDVLGRAIEETTGNSTVVNTYDFMGNKTSQTDPRNGAVCIKWTYDYAGRVESEKRYTDAGEVTANTEYDAFGNKKTSTDFRRKQTQYSYDVLGRLLEQKADFSGSDKAVTQYYYDPAGNIIKQKALTSGNVYRETEYLYDKRYRLTDTIMNDGTSNPPRTRYEYDGMGNKTAMYTGMLGASTSGAAKTTYTYDRFGNMKTMTDPIGNSPNPSDPARRTESNTYDNYGQLRQKKDRNGFVTTYTYDGLGRVRREAVVDSDGQVTDNYRAFSYYKNGLKSTEKNGEISVSFAYDNMGRLITQTETGAGHNVVKSYGYDQCGNRTSFIMSKDGAAQVSLTYRYDKQNRLKEVLRNSVKIAGYTYDANGNRESLTYPQSGLSVSYIYNDMNLVTDLYNLKDGAHRSSYHYSYLLDGNQSRKTAKVSGKPDQVTDYLYDLLGRLTEEKESGGSTIVYAYDLFSNRLKMTVTDVNNKITTTGYEYDLRNRLQTETKTYDGTEEILHYRYDFNGNQIYREWEKFSPKKEKKTPGRAGFYSGKFKEDVAVLEMREYNGFGELVCLYQDAMETRYAYRPDGLRHRKLFEDGTTASHIWDGQNIVAEYGANGNVTARYLRGINLIARDQDNLLQYCLFNAHGDVVQRTDQNGNALKNYDYDAFGVEKSPEPLDVNPFRYCGEYLDLETNTYYLRARSYAPRLGRFTQEDIAKDGLNWYTYCGNSPIRYTDPSGNFKWDLTEKEMKSVNYDPWAMEALAVKKAFESEWFGTYYSSHMKYEGIEVSYQFKIKVLDVCEELGIKPDDLMTLMATESKIATRESPYGGRGGLLQFTSSTAKRMGYTLNEITSMDGLQQLDVVRDFFKLNLDTYKKADPQNIIDLYTLMFLPSGGGFGQGDSFEIMSTTNANYGGNSAMNVDKVGGISRGDLRAWIALEMEKYKNNRR